MPIILRSHRCVLYGKDETELAKLGEFPLDPGGYFVVKGNEKVIQIQEQLLNNRIIIEVDKKGNLVASVTCSAATLRTKSIIVMEKEKIYLQLNSFQTKVPIMVVMKAMGMQSDQEVMQMIGRDPRYSSLLLPSIEECATLGVHSKQQALEFLDNKVKKSQFASAQPEKEDRALPILRDVFLAHVPVCENNFRAKCIYAAVMLRRLLEAFLNKAAVDDKDYVINKRFELSGQLLSLLFEDLFKTMITEVKRKVDAILIKKSQSSRFDFSQHIIADTISFGLERALSTGNWFIKRFKMDKKGVTQVLGRLSYIQALGFLTKIQPQFEKSRKVSGPRALQPSLWGVLCPCDTPEGESCGLVKNLALMTHVTTDEEEGPLISLFSFKLACQNKEQKYMHGTTTSLFLREGLIEYLDVNEENNALIALYQDQAQLETTHIEIEPFTILGVISPSQPVTSKYLSGIHIFFSLCTSVIVVMSIPYSINKISIDLVIWNLTELLVVGFRKCTKYLRIESNVTPLWILDFNLVYFFEKTWVFVLLIQVKYDKLGAGQNATVAVMSYSGYDIEDAIVMNKSSLDRGFGRCIVMKKKNAIMQRYENNASERIIPPIREGFFAERMQVVSFCSMCHIVEGLLFVIPSIAFCLCV
ncbi:DNA-directed RNA polymerase III subunit 2-like [Spinacia oleracea]|uniref:DNA-directed RNA polymerase n=1 Tax=Spinacia oleracea TaxID=3562 RepID=A0ABM3QRD5_SPIOL|nr:DNA-directed RNA polymerase III subunit 2-like [Spinacia oleracea]